MPLTDLFRKILEVPIEETAGADADGDLLMFYLPGCPYCRQAERLIEELCEEHPEYQKIRIRRVNEVLERALAEQYNYWYVPSFFLCGEKLYEADSGDDAAVVKEKLAGVFQQALKEA